MWFLGSFQASSPRLGFVQAEDGSRIQLQSHPSSKLGRWPDKPELGSQALPDSLADLEVEQMCTCHRLGYHGQYLGSFYSECCLGMEATWRRG